MSIPTGDAYVGSNKENYTILPIEIDPSDVPTGKSNSSSEADVTVEVYNAADVASSEDQDFPPPSTSSSSNYSAVDIFSVLANIQSILSKNSEDSRKINLQKRELSFEKALSAAAEALSGAGANFGFQLLAAGASGAAGVSGLKSSARNVGDIKSTISVKQSKLDELNAKIAKGGKDDLVPLRDVLQNTVDSKKASAVEKHLEHASGISDAKKRAEYLDENLGLDDAGQLTPKDYSKQSLSKDFLGEDQAKITERHTQAIKREQVANEALRESKTQLFSLIDSRTQRSQSFGGAGQAGSGALGSAGGYAQSTYQEEADTESAESERARASGEVFRDDAQLFQQIASEALQTFSAVNDNFANGVLRATQA